MSVVLVCVSCVLNIYLHFLRVTCIRYAVTVLKVPHIIVCGHYDCGGVRASCQSLDHHPPLENWLGKVRDVYRLHREELDAIEDPEARHRRLVEINVIEQCVNLFKTGTIQRQRIETFQDPSIPFTQPRIHACVYDPQDGQLKQLQVDFKEYIKDLHGIYSLYQLGDKNAMVN
jgi:carbonic anhydrase